MGYHPYVRATRNYRRHEKAKAKFTVQKHHTDRYGLEEHALTLEEVADKALTKLGNLGNQQFGLPPFSEHFIRWLISLRDALSEFESNPAISVDEQFVSERSQILSSIELSVDETRRREASCEAAARNLTEAKAVLGQLEAEYAAKQREAEKKKNSEARRLSSDVDAAKEEIAQLTHARRGILGAFPRRGNAQKEAEAAEKLSAAQNRLTALEQGFTAEKELLKQEYEAKRQPLTAQITEYQREVRSQQTDGSAETRKKLCDALANSITALLQRTPKPSNDPK